MFKRSRKPQRGGTGAKLTIEIGATAEQVWRILLDKQSHAKLYRSCIEVNNLDPRKSLSPIEPGARYVDKRTFHGRGMEFICSVTTVDDNQRLYAEATTFHRCTATSSVRVEDIESDHCRLSASYGMVPDGWLGKLHLWRNKRRLERNGHEEMMLDLEDIKLAAETGEYKNDTTERNTSSSDVDLSARTHHR